MNWVLIATKINWTELAAKWYLTRKVLSIALVMFTVFFVVAYLGYHYITDKLHQWKRR